MGDPVSIVTGIVGLLATIGATVRFIKDVRNAPKDILEINEELLTLKEVLEWLKSNIDPLPITDSLRTQMLCIISDCHRTTESLHEVIQKYSGPLGRHKWPITGKDKVAALRRKLAQSRETMRTMLGGAGV